MNHRASIALILTAAVLVWTVSRQPSMNAALATVGSQSDHSDAERTVPPIRVRIGPAHRETATLSVEGPYQITPVDDWRVLAQGKRLDRQAVHFRNGQLRIGEKAWPIDAIEVRVIEDGTLWIGDVRYRGNARVVADSSDRFSIVNVVDLHDYLASVLNSEMPGDFPVDARRAQVIAARTYAVFHMKTFGTTAPYDVTDGVMSQSYLGVVRRDGQGKEWAVETADSREIADSSRGITLTYQGRLFCTFYTAVCGGRTADGRDVFEHAAPPLVAIRCEFCRGAKNYRWNRGAPREAVFGVLSEQLRQQGHAIKSITAVTTMEDGDGAPGVRILAGGDVVTVSTRNLRQMLFDVVQLPSDDYTITMQDGELQFAGGGWGHRVGMCQWGARGQALEGFDYGSILAYYYPGTELIRIE